MSHSTFLVICAVLAAVPFLAGCLKGRPVTGVVSAVISLTLMFVFATHGGSMFEVHATGFIVAGLGIAYAVGGD